MSRIQAVQEIYQAFGRGDVPAILDRLRDDVEWEPELEHYGVPWLKPGRGKQHVGSFFQTIGEQLTFEAFEPLNLLEGGDQVAAVIRVRGHASGRRIDGLELHLWTFDAAGKVSALRHFLDTHQHVLAAVG